MTQNTIDYDFGDIVLVPFPFTNQTTTKKRPAIIVSSCLYQQRRPDVVLMAITSQIKEKSKDLDFFINQWKEAGLLKPSVVKPVFATIEKKLITQKLGALSIEEQKLFQEVIKIILGFKW